jgi:hypothetical protein
MCTYIIITMVSKEAIHQVLQLRKLEKKTWTRLTQTLFPRSVRVPRTPLSLQICRQHIRSVPNIGAVMMAGLKAILLHTAHTLQV